jgi:hypothetical protein
MRTYSSWYNFYLLLSWWVYSSFRFYCSYLCFLIKDYTYFYSIFFNYSLVLFCSSSLFSNCSFSIYRQDIVYCNCHTYWLYCLNCICLSLRMLLSLFPTLRLSSMLYLFLYMLFSIYISMLCLLVISLFSFSMYRICSLYLDMASFLFYSIFISSSTSFSSRYAFFSSSSYFYF